MCVTTYIISDYMKSALIFLPKCHAELPNRAILTELNIVRDEDRVSVTHQVGFINGISIDQTERYVIRNNTHHSV